MAKTGVIIVAGGSGTRMGSEEPKQFIAIAGKEILVRTLEKFLCALPGADIVVVLPAGEFPRWDSIVRRHGLEGTHRCCAGGRNRYLSVKNGLGALGKCDYIAVHDGVRPLLSEEMIKRCVESAECNRTAVPVVEPVDSFRLILNGKADIIDRAQLRAVQTPQVFRADILREAYDAEYSVSFTDDASVVERYGVQLSFCRGEHGNIKITRPGDLIYAEAVINSEKKGM